MTPPLMKLPQEFEKERIQEIIREVLEDRYIKLCFGNNYCISEDIQKKTTCIDDSLLFTLKDHSKIIPMSGEGSGPVDALFNSLRSTYLDEYKFLRELLFVEFKADANTGLVKRLRSAAPVNAVLIVQIQNKRELAFRKESMSINQCALDVVMQCFEHFVNAEQAIKTIRETMKDSRKRNRGDIYEKSLLRLSKITQSSCSDL